VRAFSFPTNARTPCEPRAHGSVDPALLHALEAHIATLKGENETLKGQLAAAEARAAGRACFRVPLRTRGSAATGGRSSAGVPSHREARWRAFCQLDKLADRPPPARNDGADRASKQGRPAQAADTRPAASQRDVQQPLHGPAEAAGWRALASFLLVSLPRPVDTAGGADPALLGPTLQDRAKVQQSAVRFAEAPTWWARRALHQEIAMSLLATIKPNGPSGFGYGSTAEDVTVGLSLNGKTYLLTGCNSGLGFETLRVLRLRGAQVIAAARTLEKARAACASVKGLTTPVACELAEPASVRASVATVKALNVPIDGIICNAGIMALPKLNQAYGYELQFFTNHIGHFMLVTGLIDTLATDAHVIAASSRAGRKARGPCTPSRTASYWPSTAPRLSRSKCNSSCRRKVGPKSDSAIGSGFTESPSFQDRCRPATSFNRVQFVRRN
jgi:hypothetical protein